MDVVNRWKKLSKAMKVMTFYSLIADALCVIIFIIMVKVTTAREEAEYDAAYNNVDP